MQLCDARAGAWLLASMVGLLSTASPSQSQQTVPLATKANGDAVAAQVGPDRVLKSELTYELARLTRDRKLPADDVDRLRAALTEQLVNQSLVLQRISKDRVVATDKEIEGVIQKLRTQVEERGERFADYLRQLDTDDAGLRNRLRWQISWSRYLERMLTDEHLTKFFQKHKRDFDGTELHVAHILVAVPATASKSDRESARERATQVLEKIRSGQMSFADAARKFSDAPTADQGGDIGKIQRHAPMPEPFSRAAFALNAGEVSEPVETTFGFHLIQILKIHEGERTWEQARPELELAATQYLFHWLADKQRPLTRVDIR